MQLKQSRVIIFSLIALISSSTSAFSWPFSSKKSTDSEKVKSQAVSTSNSRTSSVKRAVASSSSQASPDENTDDSLVLPEIPKIPQKVVTSLPKVPHGGIVADVPKVPSARVKGSVAAPNGEDAEITRVRSQIREIMKINENLKSNSAGQASEIQKISEQAKIHEKILTELQKSKELAHKASADNYLNQEKVRLIDKETKENQKFLANLKKKKEETPA